MADVPNLSSQSIAEKVYKWLLDSIIDGTFPPGSQISIRDISNTLGVSSSPVKEAMYRLQGQNMLEVTSRKGTYVKKITEKDLINICEARLCLEVGAIDLIKQPLTERQIAKIEHCYQRAIREEVTDSTTLMEYMRRDFLFHYSIIETVENDVLAKLYKQLNPQVQIVSYAIGSKKARPYKNVNQEHSDILNCLKKDDIQGAKKAVRNHLNSIMNLDFASFKSK